MCNIMMMRSRMPAYVDDPAMKPSAGKRELSVPSPPTLLVNLTDTVTPLSLPVLRIGGRKPELWSEKFVRNPSGVSFESKAFQLRTQAKIAELVRTASAETCSTNSLLAKKALKFRKVLGSVPFARAAAVQC